VRVVRACKIVVVVSNKQQLGDCALWVQAPRPQRTSLEGHEMSNTQHLLPCSFLHSNATISPCALPQHTSCMDVSPLLVVACLLLGGAAGLALQRMVGARPHLLPSIKRQQPKKSPSDDHSHAHCMCIACVAWPLTDSIGLNSSSGGCGATRRKATHSTQGHTQASSKHQGLPPRQHSEGTKLQRVALALTEGCLQPT